MTTRIDPSQRYPVEAGGRIVASYYLELIYEPDASGEVHMAAVEVVCTVCDTRIDGLQPQLVQRLKRHARGRHWPKAERR